MKIKTIDITTKEWFDKVNGNSYFSGNIVLNYGMKNQVNIPMLFQYGSGEQYIHTANEVLQNNEYIPNSKSARGFSTPLWQYCQENNIVLRTTKYENCLKRELQTN